MRSVTTSVICKKSVAAFTFTKKNPLFYKFVLDTYAHLFQKVKYQLFVFIYNFTVYIMW